MDERTKMSAKEMPAGEMTEEKSDSETILGATDAMPETTTRGSETGEDMPRPDMTQPGTQQIGEMPVSEMTEQKSVSGRPISG
jgi:hypothetical protein